MSQERRPGCPLPRSSSICILSGPHAQVTSLIHHERVRTTVSKAKELRRLADRVITLAKKGTPQARQKAGGIVRTEWDLAKLLTSAPRRSPASSEPPLPPAPTQPPTAESTGEALVAVVVVVVVVSWEAHSTTRAVLGVLELRYWSYLGPSVERT